jgi:DNA-binding response OmpR family regulator
MLGIQLQSLGLEVNLAATADEALRWSETKDFDIYLLDSWLPDLDGYELCRQVRQRALRADRILFFSGAAHELDRQKGIEAGARAYVFKPDVGELLNTLSTLIAEASAVEPEASSRRRDLPD